MRKISDTIARLAMARATRLSPTSAAGSGERLMTLADFGSNPGALTAKLYVPQNLAGGAPLIVVLHGCTQNADGYDHHSGWSKIADELGCTLLYAEQNRANNPNLCFNWFVPEDIHRDCGEALSIRQMIEAVVIAHDIDRQRIFVTGLSAGGAMAAVMLAAYPEVFAGGAIIAGLPYGSARTIPEAFDRMRGHGIPSERELQSLLETAAPSTAQPPRISVWQGSADTTVAPSNAEAIAGQWRGVHGLEQAPKHSQRTGRLTKQTWCNSDGQSIIEINTIDSMGHGTPLGDDGIGTPGPYMLDVGISSTRKIADFWGLSANEAANSEASSSVVLTDSMPQTTSRQHSPSNTTATVKKTIEDALRSAGLLR